MSESSDKDSKTWREYDYCTRLEQELVKSRWTFFTALLSVSFLVGGLALKEFQSLGPQFGKIAFAFGWLIYLGAFCHYWWFHRKSDDLREHLCKLETQLGITVYLIRSRRPKIGPLPLRYHWAIDAQLVAYTIILILVLIR